MTDIYTTVKQKLQYAMRLFDTGAVDPATNLPVMARGMMTLGPDGLPVAATSYDLADITDSGPLNTATLNDAYTLSVNGRGVAAFAISGLTASGATLTLEASNNGGTTWSTAVGVSGGTGILNSTFTADTQFRMNAGGRTKIRLRVSSIGAGAITVASNLSRVSSDVSLSSPIPAGGNKIGDVGVTGTVTVAQLGAAGTDYSANKPALPVLTATLGAAFGGASSYSAYVLLAIVPANANRKGLWAQNQSANRAVIVYHDGTQVTVGQALNNAGVCVLEAGAGSAAQGADSPPIFDKFRGAWLVYAPTGSQIAILEL